MSTFGPLARRNPRSLLGTAAWALLLAAASCSPDADAPPGAKDAVPAARPATAGASATATPGGALPDLVPASASEVLATIAGAEADAVLLNVWATWCQPCREELPDIMRIYHELRPRGLLLVLVSADFDSERDAARRFLAAQGVDFTSYVKTGKDMEFIDTIDPRWTGALPAGWVFDAAGEPRHFWENKASYDQMRDAVIDVLDQPRR